ncbi:MAG: hypothetical protein QXF75_01300 [Candidatus Bathyarchaeia archaeon]
MCVDTFCIVLWITTVIKPSFEDIPTTDIPLFKILNKEITSFVGGANITLTFRNYGYSATSGTVWIPWEKVWYGIKLSGHPPRGNISEAVLPFDVNGDGDIADVFTVGYIDNKTVLIEGTPVYAMRFPEQMAPYDFGMYMIWERRDFTLGSKTHALYRVTYYPAQNYGYAAFGLESFFRDHPSPNIEFVIERAADSINSPATAEITYMEINGVSIPYEFNRVFAALDDQQWFVENVYVYPLGSVANGTTFTVKLTITGDPAAYLFHAIINWSPDASHLYRFYVWEAEDIPIGISGTVHRQVDYGGETFNIDINTNSTISPIIAFNSTKKEISFKAAIYPDYRKPAMYFWNISIPQNLLTDNPWTVSLDGETIPFISTTNGTHTFLYFNYSFQYWFIIHTISIKGTWAIPEATPNTLLPFFIIIIFLVSTLYKRSDVTSTRATKDS